MEAKTFIFVLLLLQETLVKGSSFEQFFVPSLESVLIFNKDVSKDASFVEFSNIVNHNLWMSYTQEPIIPEDVRNTLIVLDAISPSHFNILLNTNTDIQASLSHNIWLSQLKDSSKVCQDYFQQVELKIGLNAQIFCIKETQVTQVLGTGSQHVIFKVIEKPFCLMIKIQTYI